MEWIKKSFSPLCMWSEATIASTGRIERERRQSWQKKNEVFFCIPEHIFTLSEKISMPFLMAQLLFVHCSASERSREESCWERERVSEESMLLSIVCEKSRKRVLPMCRAVSTHQIIYIYIHCNGMSYSTSFCSCSVVMLLLFAKFATFHFQQFTHNANYANAKQQRTVIFSTKKSALLRYENMGKRYKRAKYTGDKLPHIFSTWNISKLRSTTSKIRLFVFNKAKETLTDSLFLETFD